MLDLCFNCGEEYSDETDIYYELVGRCGTIRFCESCGENFNIPNKRNDLLGDESVYIPATEDLTSCCKCGSHNVEMRGEGFNAVVKCTCGNIRGGFATREGLIRAWNDENIW